LLKKGQAACGTSGGTQVPAEIVTAPGDTGPYNSGDLAGAVQVFFFVLAIGAFITVTIKTGALDAGIGRVTERFRKRGLLLIVILMVIFSVGGTTYGMAEETLGFYAIICRSSSPWVTTDWSGWGSSWSGPGWGRWARR